MSAMFKGFLSFVSLLTLQCFAYLEKDIRIERLSMESQVSMRFSEVTIQAKLRNAALTGKDTFVDINLPKSAFITNFAVVVNDVEYTAVVKEKTVATEEYQTALENNMTAGYVSQQSQLVDDFDRDKFRIALHLAPESSASFYLRYQELIIRQGNVYKQKLFVNPNLFVSQIEVIYDITETQPMKSFQYRTPFDDAFISDTSEIRVSNGYYKRRVYWSPASKEGTATTFQENDAFDVFYDLEPVENGGELLTHINGQFAHYFSTTCEQQNLIPKRIAFVIDVSGSMKNIPIQQVRKAMVSILDQLRTGEFFNIVLFSNTVSLWKSTFLLASQTNINDAKKYLSKKLVAHGSTNINDALLKALDLFRDINEKADHTQNLYGQILVLLTDGEPTIGVTSVDSIRRNVRNVNYFQGKECCRASIYTVAFGQNSNKEFLVALSNENDGDTKIVKVKNSLENYLVLYDFFGNLENPYFKFVNFSFKVMDKNVFLPQSNLTQTFFPLFDCGSEIIVSGWSDPQTVIQPRVEAVGIQGTITFDSITQKPISDEQAAILSKIIVHQQVKELLEQIERDIDGIHSETSKQTALALSLEYGLVTPLTAMIVTVYSTVPKQPTKMSDRRGTGPINKSTRSTNIPRYPEAEENTDVEERLTATNRGSHNSCTVFGSNVFLVVIITVLTLSAAK